MGFDNLHKKRQGNLKKRKENIKEVEPLRFLIVCEGKKTEPNYFEPLKNQINAKYRPDLINLKVECIDIVGAGKNTESLIDYTIKLRDNANINYGNVWCVFDKDSFTSNQFNNAISKAGNENIKTAWSNEAIELWFLLHFEYLNTGIGREQYIEKLNGHFKKYKINKGKYEKSLNDIYQILEKCGNYDNAVKYAKKLEKINLKETPAKSKPMTKVYELVEELKVLLEK